MARSSDNSSMSFSKSLIPALLTIVNVNNHSLVWSWLGISGVSGCGEEWRTSAELGFFIFYLFLNLVGDLTYKNTIVLEYFSN